MTADATTLTAAEGWTPARIFLAISASYHLLLGLVGLAIDQTFPIGELDAARADSEHIFGIFETNGWHSLAALLLGAASIYLMTRPAYERTGALAVGLSQGVVVVALALFPPSTFWFASNAADQVIHSATAVGGIASALLTRPARSLASASPV